MIRKGAEGQERNKLSEVAWAIGGSARVSLETSSVLPGKSPALRMEAPLELTGEACPV